MTRRLLIGFALIFGLLSRADAVDITVCWTHAPCPDVTHYRVYSGTASGVYNNWVDVGYVNRVVLEGFSPNVKYFFTVTAWGPAGESVKAAEVSITKPESVAPAAPTNLHLGAP